MPENCRFGAPLKKHVELKEFLPTGRMEGDQVSQELTSGVTFGTRKFDDVFTDWEVSAGERESWMVDDHADLKVRYVADPQHFRDLVVYTPPNRNAFCLEPYTCLTDAINLQSQGIDAGLQVLAPGATVKTWLKLEVGQV
jgi:aldose 1-epimerase